jgi:hypothetical protein
MTLRIIIRTRIPAPIPMIGYNPKPKNFVSSAGKASSAGVVSSSLASAPTLGADFLVDEVGFALGFTVEVVGEVVVAAGLLVGVGVLVGVDVDVAGAGALVGVSTTGATTGSAGLGATGATTVGLTSIDLAG